MITAENARELQRKGVEARKARKLLAESLPSPPTDSQPEPVKPEVVTDDFHIKKLVRVRKQWDSLDRMIADETEPAKLDRLIAALARVEEIERRLSSRSLPPTLRANDKSRSNRRPGGQPTPQPVTPSVPSASTPPVEKPQ